MKITNVRACQPIAPGSPADWRTSLGQIVVVVETDVGLIGYGVGGGGKAGVHVVETVLRDVTVGRDPEPVEALWDAMYQATLAFGRKGLAIMALSGVDLALWDLRGKAARLPVAALLGTMRTTPIPVYHTVWDRLAPEELGRYRAYKLHVGRADELTVDSLVATVSELRRTVGPGVPLMIDAWMRWNIDFTRQAAAALAPAAHALRPLTIDWIEEPLSPDDVDGYRALVRDCPVPIAGGEHEFTAIGFEPLIAERLHHVLQPDVCWCGGMTELVKIYRRARAAGLRVCPHRGAEIWGLHALAALDPDPLAETGRPWMSWVAGQPPIVDGMIALPDEPGFGVQIDERRLQLL
jgi:L-rhamnonate dehydratase